MKSHSPDLVRILLKSVAAVLLGVVVAFSGDEALAQAQGGFADKRMQDFQRRRACEQNLPTCLPQVRRQMEQERRNQMWMGGMIAGVMFLTFLMIVRANRQKQIEQQQLLAKGRQAARQRKEMRRKAKKGDEDEDDFDDEDDGLSVRSTLERPPGFSKR